MHRQENNYYDKNILFNYDLPGSADSLFRLSFICTSETAELRIGRD